MVSCLQYLCGHSYATMALACFAHALPVHVCALRHHKKATRRQLIPFSYRRRRLPINISAQQAGIIFLCYHNRNGTEMKEDKKTNVDNSLFITTFAGVALLIVSLWGVLFSVHSAAGIESSILFLSLPGSSSALLLYKAIRKDKNRIRQAH